MYSWQMINDDSNTSDRQIDGQTGGQHWLSNKGYIVSHGNVHHANDYSRITSVSGPSRQKQVGSLMGCYHP